MRYDEIDQEPRVRPKVSKPTNQELDTDEDTERAKIPLKIDDALMVCSLTHSTHMARARIIGAVRGEFIVITEPTVPIAERNSVILDESFLCAYFNNGFLFNFQSRYREKLMNNLVCIEYPKEVEVRRIRKDCRINVNIETQLVVQGIADLLMGDMMDISKGGCRVALNQPVGITVGSIVSLTFVLPTEALVNRIHAKVVRVARIKGSRMTTLGCSFTGSSNETSKVANFCDFCMYFEVR